MNDKIYYLIPLYGLYLFLEEDGPWEISEVALLYYLIYQIIWGICAITVILIIILNIIL